MPRITLDLLRKRAEHNEGLVQSLEEISLHQEELEKIEVIGTLCRKLKILYLQNNIIEKIEDLTHMKDLEYLNMALNNITKIEGLQNCEFLNKLDLTVNFIDFDTLEESVEHLKPLTSLRDLYMMGNPAQTNWEGFNAYIIASLPQLTRLDGKDITRTDRIKANQELSYLERELKQLAKQLILKKQEEKDVIEVIEGQATDVSNSITIEDVDEEEEEQKTEYRKAQVDTEKQPYTPATRREMYLELAEQKEEQEKQRKENAPKERDYDKEHREAREKQRERDASGQIRQCNEGQWDFYMDEDEVPGSIVVEVSLPKYLDSSLIDVDAHPTHVTVVIKNKTLRLRFPEECHSDSGKAERSKVTGALRLIFPKADEKSVERSLRAKQRFKDDQEEAQRKKKAEQDDKEAKREKKIGEMMLKAVSIKGIVKNPELNQGCSIKAIKSRVGDGDYVASPQDDDDQVPPLM